MRQFRLCCGIPSSNRRRRCMPNRATANCERG
ncbi:MAG: hypothetical protein FJ403_17445 [Verrucomicrobia bacterium]|nr:hypothetical protein [Verrucomicrobiota bacterium]